MDQPLSAINNLGKLKTSSNIKACRHMFVMRTPIRTSVDAVSPAGIVVCAPLYSPR